LDKEFELVRKILSGDLHKFEDLINSYQKLVSHIVFRMVSDAHDREELCHEVFIKVYQNLNRFNFNAKLSTWIAKIAHNHCINFLRKNKLILFDDMQNSDEGNGEYQFSESLHSKSIMPDEITEQNERGTNIRKEIESLPENYKIILTLYHVDEMSYNDIAGIVDMPQGTVKSYLFRARKMLKEKLVTKYQGEELWQ